VQETEDVFADDTEELQAVRRTPFWKKRQFREIYVPVMACTLLLSLAILLRIIWKQTVSLPTPNRPS
jgi:hypothetical protein